MKHYICSAGRPLACLWIILFAATAFAGSSPFLSGHGINFSTGNKYISERDASLAGPVASLNFSRNYNSQSTDDTIFGYGWSFSENESLQIESGLELIVYSRSDGHMLHFYSSGTDQWTNAVGPKAVITKLPDGYQLSLPEGQIKLFNVSGKIVVRRDNNGNQIVYTYDGNNLKSISDAFGRSLTLAYNADGKVETLTAPVGTFTYTYDAIHNLTSVTQPGGKQRTYLYEDTLNPHNLTGILNENNTRVLTVGYDTLDRVVSSAFANGREKVTIAYQAGYKRVITDSLGAVTTYQLESWQGVAQVKSFTGPGCSSCGSDTASQYTYDFRQQVTSQTNARGVVTTYAYDESGNRIRETHAAGTSLESTVATTYTPDFNKPATITEPSLSNAGQHKVTTLTYDAAGNQITRTESGFNGSTAINRTTATAYDAAGRITSIDGPRTDVDDTVTLAYYDNTPEQGLNRGFLRTVTNALGHQVIYSNYNGMGLPGQILEASGLATTFTYNDQGRVTSQKTGNQTTVYRYDAAGILLSVTLPGSRTITYDYNPSGKVAKITDQIGNSISFAYDTEGRVLRREVHDPDGKLTTSISAEYDSAGRLLKLIHPDGSNEQRSYDQVGNVIGSANGLGQSTSYAYDVLNRLNTLTEPASTTGFAYDLHGNQTAVTDAAGKVTRYSYDDFDNRVAIDSPVTGTTTLQYDDAGNMIKKTDANNTSISYSYDPLNRMTGTVYTDAALNVTYTYDVGPNGKGRLTGIKDNSGSFGFEYDQYGNLAVETATINGHAFTTAYTYNENRELTAVAYPSSRTVHYERDATGNVTKVSSTYQGQTSILTENISRLPFGPITTMTMGNGLSVASVYDQQYRLASVQAGELFNRAYSYNAVSQVTAINDQLENTRSQTFTYDAASRLIMAKGSYGTLGYTYDNVGNRLTSAKDGASTSYIYDTATNRLQQQTQGTETVNYSYDAAGNIVNKGGQQYTWNQDNRLAAVAVGAAATGQYSYDFRGLRKIAVTAEGTTLSLHDPSGNLLAESDSQGNILREYAYLDNQRLSLFDYTSLPAFAVNVATSSGTVIEGVQAYAFDENNQYTNFHAATDAEGNALFNREDFGEGSYRFRVDYLGHQLWTEAVVVRTSRGVDLVIQEAPVAVNVALNDATQEGATVYVFSESGEYLGISGVTDSQGRISFTLPAGGKYTFRTELFGQHYASALTTVGAGATASVDSGGGVLTLHIADDAGTILPGLKTTLHAENGTYLGVSKIGTAEGAVSYALPSGKYKIKAEYLGYFFWSATLTITANTSETLTIPRRDLKARVSLQYTTTVTPLASVPCTLFTPTGNELGQQRTSNGQGEAVFTVPQAPYRVRATYLAQEYWSGDVTWQDASITIAAGRAGVKVTVNGSPLAGSTVRVYAASGVDTGLSALTDGQGQTFFTLPGGGYRFQAEHEGKLFWSGDLTVTPDQEIQTTISTGGGSFTLTLTDGQNPLPGVKTMLYSASGQYLNQSVSTSGDGAASYNLADGTYRVAASYLGYEYTTGLFTIPTVASQTLPIPHQAHTVSVYRTFQDDRIPLAATTVNLCTAEGLPLALHVTTGTDGKAQLTLPVQSYTLQALYLGRTYLSDPFTAGDPAILIPEGIARVSLIKAGSPLPGVQVTAVSDTDPDHPQSGLTNSEGMVSFRLPAGGYTFKATDEAVEYQGIGEVTADQTTEITLRLGASTLSFTVRKDASTVMPGLTCTLCDAEGNPLERTATTDSSGVATFTLEDGSYQIKVQYLGYDFYSELIETPATLSTSLLIAHRDLAIRILRDQGMGGEAVAGLRCYLYSGGQEQGLTATGLFADSDDSGMVHFQVPEEQSYCGVATLLGRDFISVPGEEGSTLTIELGTMTVTVRDDGMVTEANPEGYVQNAEVALFTAEGVSLAHALITDVNGQVGFTLPESSYKLRVTYNGQQYWSSAIYTMPLGDTPVTISNGYGGVLSRLHNPNPELWHGTPPAYTPHLVLASGSLAGMLATSSTAVAAQPQAFYYLNDHLGTAQVITDATGAVVWQGDYQPFGQVTEVVNQIDHRFRFPGQMLDPESGLHYNWNRFYDPATGRYLSADPIGLDGGMNLYAYVSNDPVNKADLLGLEECSPIKDCFNKCIKDNYGESFDVALGLSPFSTLSLAQDAYNNFTEAIAKDTLKSLPLEGAFTKGDITKKTAAASKAANRAKILSPLTKGLGAISKASGLTGAGAGGYVAGASMYCAAKCTVQ